jgi:hypothetical protein
MLNENEDKEAIIRQQKLIIEDQLSTIGKQHLELAEFKHRCNKFALCDKHPVDYLMWIYLRDVWPFKYLWRVPQ